ncbi:MAG TPA: aconitate hydratase AcnA, partial [Verrucomicrobiae bacterium]|nr:aconitate hydratase AcnA [Verrucomicrobiae bacterium]
MNEAQDFFNTLQKFDLGNGRQGSFYSLPQLEKAGVGPISKLPVSIRIVLESVLRNCDGKRITEANVRALANWQPKAERVEEIPFVVARIVLQDFTGVPLLVDLAAMRSAVARLGKNPKIIEPLVPVDLVVDHSVQVDYFGTAEAFGKNLEREFERNRERYQFLKWGMQAFNTFKVVPPGIGIVHQVNLEYLAKGVLSAESQISNQKTQIYYPDTLVGTDSHTTMINGLGIVGWGVGGIEAEAGMLGQPVYFLTPDVVGVHLTGALREGVTATDLALTITQLLRKAKVVGKFVEFFGPGAKALPVVDRATIGNMSPEYGATMGFFPIDEECVNYLRATGRSEEHCRAYENYYRAQGLWGIPKSGEVNYSQVVELDLASVVPSVAGPKRPQDRIELPKMKQEFAATFSKPVSESGFGKPPEELGKKFMVSCRDGFAFGGGSQEPVSMRTSVAQNTNPLTELEMANNRPTPDNIGTPGPDCDGEIHHGSVLIAAITSCTNTSNPSVMLAAGLLAKKAVERGLQVNPLVKASLAPGSRVVSDYLNKTGLQPYLDKLGFNLVGYGCTTCIGNSGPLPAPIDEAISKYDLVAASVLSGNRNFEGRIHQDVRANYLASPPLVVVYALMGSMASDPYHEPLGQDRNGNAVYLKDIWPSQREIAELMGSTISPAMYREQYTDVFTGSDAWRALPVPEGELYQ